MRRFFYKITDTLSDAYNTQQPLPLTEDIYHHWCKVLRAKVGDCAVLFDGKGGEYTAHLCQIHKKSAEVIVSDFNPVNRTLDYFVTLGLVVSRGERMDYALQKACEMGVGGVQLLSSKHCQVNLSDTAKTAKTAKKLTHWQSVLISACEQCGMNIVPPLHAPITLDDWLINAKGKLKLVLTLPNPSDTKANNHLMALPNSIDLLIGSEGGLSDDEIAQAKRLGFVSWNIGERILRTETAPVAALACLHMLHLNSKTA